MIFISNNHIKATFSTKGAEVQSISGIDSLTEFLWSGNPQYWGKHSPVLFPIVGALKENTYQYEGNSYTLPRHGFARDLDFSYEKINEQEIVFELQHSAETLAIYPFEFILRIRYRITGASFCCTYEVSNPASSELLFSIGGHPAFAAPRDKEGEYTDYYLAFDEDEQLTYHHVVDNLITTETSVLKLEDKKLFLTHALFYNDALVMKNLKSEEISLLNTKNYHGLNFKFEGFPYFGIWAAKDADFVCLEPWCGISDAETHHQQLKDKEGIITLGARQNWERMWQVTFF